MLNDGYGYIDNGSILNKINPLIKMIGLIIYILICFLKYNNILFICNISFVFMLILFSNIEIIKYLKIVWKLKYILIFIYVLLYRLEVEIVMINAILFEIVFFFFYIEIIGFTTNRDDIIKSLSKIINIFNIIGINIKKIELKVTNIFVYIETFKSTYKEFIKYNQIYGMIYNKDFISKVKFYKKNIKIIKEITKKKMNDRKYDMRFRLYNERVKKKYKYRNKLFVFDYIYVILNIAMIVFYILKVR